MKTSKISDFTLERFRLGELSPGDHLTIREALVKDKDLRIAFETLDESDKELRLKYPYESLRLPKGNTHPPRNRFRRAAFLAAAVFVCIVCPIAYFARYIPENTPQDRAKGMRSADIELSLYLKGDHDAPLQKQMVLHEGNTVQLAYSAPVGEYYGVIFSIDGRSEVTMHYPYQRGQSSLLVGGRRTFLNEAYTLDDAPDFEVFVMVVSPEPLDAEAVLWEARNVAAAGYADRAARIETEIRTAFEGCEVETLKILKE